MANRDYSFSWSMKGQRTVLHTATVFHKLVYAVYGSLVVIDANSSNNSIWFTQSAGLLKGVYSNSALQKPI